MKTNSGKMLVVDDEEPIRSLCERTLGRLGLAVEQAQNAQEALARLEREPFDCVLTDIVMPGPRDGAALTEEIRERFPATDVIVMTGAPTLAGAVSTLTHGALDYLSKPFGPTALESTVARCFEKRRLAAELHGEGLLKVERAKTAFLSILNHELRTPLTIAMAAAQVLETAPDPRQTEKAASLLRSSLAREKEVVEDLLLFSSLASGEMEIQKTEVPLEEMISSLAGNYKSLWEGKQLSLEILPGQTVTPFWGDQRLLQAAFKHLLLNAIRFNKKGGRVQIRGEVRSERVDVLFTDTGIGIAPNQQERIFDRFYQVAEHLTRQVGGLGLGLAIARRVAEVHGGTLSVASREGEGSVFTMSLPKGDYL